MKDPATTTRAAVITSSLLSIRVLLFHQGTCAILRELKEIKNNNFKV
jgi:hypothetical protein